jgi:LmbE family N-acetylglucosaminyl deacetylase
MRLTEPDYLPSFETPLFPGPWLVFAPHPDDETYGMGGSIAKARQAGIPVSVLVLTDGALGGAVEDLILRRQQETKAALTLLGGASVLFLARPDRGLCADERTVQKAMECIQDLQAGGTAFFPGPLEPHPDHRACALLAWEALRRLGFPLRPISYDISVQSPCNALIDITAMMPTKESAMLCHASQEGERPYLRRIRALNAARSWSLAPEVHYAESFFQWPCADEPLALLFSRLQAKRAHEGFSSVAPSEEKPGPEPTIPQLEAHIQALENSLSWRMTAPLRALSRLLFTRHLN